MYENLMSFFSVLKNMLSARGKALALYKRAIKKAEHRDFGGAIADYTTVVQLPKGPLDLKAMAQLNRALAYSAAKEYPRAMDDLETLLARPETPPNIRAAALEKMGRLKRRVDPSDDPNH